MRIETIGLITIALGLLGWVLGPGFAITVFFISTLLSAAAAILLTSLGEANIQPAHLLIGFLAAAALVQPATLRSVGRSLVFPREGFWLALTAVYAVLSAVFLPRIFAARTDVFAIARLQLGPGIIAIPLVPTSGNITQPVYFAGDVVCFCLFYAYAGKPEGLTAIIRAALVCTAINLGFAAIDMGSYAAGLGDVLSVIRNGAYRMLNDATVLGFKRIVGSFPEASTFAYFTVGLFAFCARLRLGGVYSRATGPLALLSLLTLVFSTSSTGYAATSGFLIALFVVGFVQVVTGPVTKPVLVYVAVLPLAICAALIGMRLYHPVWSVLSNVVGQTVVDKLASKSGVERELWNAQALVNFTDTHGFGAGDGSVRASSFPIAVLGNIGVIGAVTYGLFLVRLLCWRRDRWAAPFPATCQSAARWACFAQLVGASVAGSFIDLGLPFFIFAGLACAGPVAERAARPAAGAAPLAARAT